MDDDEAPTLPDRIGRLGRYTLLAELAEGGMSRVYLARRDGATTPCVLKQLHVELEGHPTAARRFQREAHIVALMDHPGIARVLGAGLEAGKFCIAMEFVAGQTLEAVMARTKERGRLMPPSLAVTIALRVLEALAYAHALTDAEGRPLRLVHRDLSPGNIMLGYDGAVKIIDFGVAQGRIDSFRTAPGMMVGTLRYMSPEQASTAEVDHRCDLYTLGVVLFEMLAGRPVVERGRAVDVLEAILEEPAPRLRKERDLPHGLDAVLSRAMAKRPEDRFVDAATFRNALRSAAAPLGRANRTHIGLMVSELFPKEERAARQWTTAGLEGTNPFGAQDTEEGSSTQTSAEVEGSGARPLPPLRSASLALDATRTHHAERAAAPAVTTSVGARVEFDGTFAAFDPKRPRPFALDPAEVEAHLPELTSPPTSVLPTLGLAPASPEGSDDLLTTLEGSPSHRLDLTEPDSAGALDRPDPATEPLRAGSSISLVRPVRDDVSRALRSPSVDDYQPCDHADAAGADDNAQTNPSPVSLEGQLAGLERRILRLELALGAIVLLAGLWAFIATRS